MDYKEEYENALERCKKEFNFKNLAYSPKEIKQKLERVFPELKEGEDERIRKECISIIDAWDKECRLQGDYCEVAPECIAWLEKQGKNEEINEASYRAGIKRVLDNPESYGLEKQGEQKPTDKVETKFKAGDWIINSEGTLRHIIAVGRTGYETDKGWFTRDYYEKSFYLWTIQDAKDGDVLSFRDDTIIIFKNLYNDSSFHAYCYIEGGVLSDSTMFSWWDSNGFVPATKEQCDIFFAKMKEAGYEWDAEKKELKKIEQKTKEKTKFYDSMDDLIADALIEEIENSDLDDSSKHNRIFWIKSHRQKPAWSEEDEAYYSLLCKILNVNHPNGVFSTDGNSYFNSNVSEKQIKNWLKSLKERMKGE